MFKFANAALATLILAAPAVAQVKRDGTFTASQDCDAVVSMKKGTNPDHAAVAKGENYRLLGQNNDNATHYWIEVPSANPHQRWVAVSCGSIDSSNAATAVPKPKMVPPPVAVDTSKGTVKPKNQSRGFGGREPYYAFALSWEPAFCKAMQSKTECRALTPTSWEATHLSIHGLWPQPMRNQYCNVGAEQTALDDQHQWDALPEPQLKAETRAALNVAMPGAMSNLQRHEWIKHGTCYPAGSADQYFADAIRLTKEVNESPVQKLFADYIGKRLPAQFIHTAFDQAFGPGTGRNVQVECDRQGRLSGITMSLRGDIPGGAKLGELLKAGDPARDKCDGGVVELVR